MLRASRPRATGTRSRSRTTRLPRVGRRTDASSSQESNRLSAPSAYCLTRLGYIRTGIFFAFFRDLSYYSADMTNEIVITGACRTPIGSFGGSLSSLTAPRLGAAVISEAVRRSGVEKESVDEVIMGCVLTGGVGQAPA